MCNLEDTTLESLQIASVQIFLHFRKRTVSWGYLCNVAVFKVSSFTVSPKKATQKEVVEVGHLKKGVVTNIGMSL